MKEFIKKYLIGLTFWSLLTGTIVFIANKALLFLGIIGGITAFLVSGMIFVWTGSLLLKMTGNFQEVNYGNEFKESKARPMPKVRW